MLPPLFQNWFAQKGWTVRPHQLALVESSASVLLVAPTGGGKTLAGFLPSLIDLSFSGNLPRAKRSRARKLHTLYISPLKALAVDVARNLEIPIADMNLPVTVETRTGDTPAARRQRQRHVPPDILLTTPEQLALLIAHPRAAQLFEGLKTVVLDELHALYNSKRGDLLALGLARVGAAGAGSPAHRIVRDRRRSGALAAVPDAAASGWRIAVRTGDRPGRGQAADRDQRFDPYVPWAGHLARHAMMDVMAAIGESKTALIFVNTRSQAERTFQELWRLNEQNWPIALHHGSLAPEQRRKVEAAMTKGNLRAVVCTSTLDLGIDWGAVDKVICIGALQGRRPAGAAYRPGQSSAGRAKRGAAGSRQSFRGP